MVLQGIAYIKKFDIVHRDINLQPTACRYSFFFCAVPPLLALAL
jgi:hypothetical protein